MYLVYDVRFLFRPFLILMSVIKSAYYYVSPQVSD